MIDSKQIIEDMQGMVAELKDLKHECDIRVLDSKAIDKTIELLTRVTTWFCEGEDVMDNCQSFSFTLGEWWGRRPWRRP